MGDVSAAVARMPAEIELNLMRARILERVRPQTTTGHLKSDIEEQQATIMTQQATIAELQEQLNQVAFYVVGLEKQVATLKALLSQYRDQHGSLLTGQTGGV